MSVSPKLMRWVVDPLERASKTFVQQFVIVLMAAGSAGLLVSQNWLLGLDSAGFAALVSLGTTLLSAKLPEVGVVGDLALRVGKTFLQSFVGTLVAANVLSIHHADWKGAIAVAVPVALTALLTGLAAMGVPATAGASLVPAGIVAASGDEGGAEVDVAAEALKVSRVSNAEVELDSVNVGNPPAVES